jgi:hypothetical protein
MTKPSLTCRTSWRSFPQVWTFGLNFLRNLMGFAGARDDKIADVDDKMQGPIVWLGDPRMDNDSRSLGSDLPSEINDKGGDPTSFGR